MRNYTYVYIDSEVVICVQEGGEGFPGTCCCLSPGNPQYCETTRPSPGERMECLQGIHLGNALPWLYHGQASVCCWILCMCHENVS